jgi:malonyl-CoA O-methyltransferase
MSGANPLPARDAYPLWAARYEGENAVTQLDQMAAADLSPTLAGRRLLDAGCGTGRRIPPSSNQGPALAVGVDLARHMLLAGSRETGFARLIQADVCCLPIASGTFDLVWCRLALGHVFNLPAAYQEMHRVAGPGAWLVVTDFHADALRAGHRRTFRDATGAVRVVASRPYTCEDHRAAAEAAGFTLERHREYRVGPEVRWFYHQAGCLDRYEKDLGLALVFGLGFLHQSVGG